MHGMAYWMTGSHSPGHHHCYARGAQAPAGSKHLTVVCSLWNLTFLEAKVAGHGVANLAERLPAQQEVVVYVHATEIVQCRYLQANFHDCLCLRQYITWKKICGSWSSILRCALSLPNMAGSCFRMWPMIKRWIRKALTRLTNSLIWKDEAVHQAAHTIASQFMLCSA